MFVILTLKTCIDMNQQLAHHSVNGCNIICGIFSIWNYFRTRRRYFGSSDDKQSEKFINDGDKVIFRGAARIKL